MTKNGKTYHYILTVQDVFSRYLWLRPLTKKTSHQVARKLSKLYSEVGPPRVIQSDNGGEFKKAVEKLCQTLGIKIIRGSPYHPQSQGKVERSHRSLRKKISFDLLRFSKVGVNWASKLREYQKILNEEPMDVLGRQSPFEVFYCRESNALTQMERADQSRRIRSKAITSNNVWDKRYMRRKTKGDPSSIYKVGETVLIRYPFSRHLTHSNQDKQKDTKKSDHRKKFRIAMTRQEHYQPFLDQGYEVSYNPAGDGNCQFAALSWFLRHLGILLSEETLRKEIVDYHNNNPLAQDGFPLELFVGVPSGAVASVLSKYEPQRRLR